MKAAFTLLPRRWTSPLSTAVCMACLFGCGQGMVSSSTDDSEDSEGAPSVESSANHPYVLIAKPFVEALLAGNSAQAYELLSPKAKQQMTAAQFAEKWQALYEASFQPAAIQYLYAADLEEKHLLAGPSYEVPGELPDDKGFRVMESSRLVGDGASQFTLDEIQGAATADLINKEALEDARKEGYDLDNLEASAFLTVVIVQEAGKLYVGHFHMRPVDMLD